MRDTPDRTPQPPPARRSPTPAVLGLALTGYVLHRIRTRALRAQLAHAQHTARHDPLTGLPNRRLVLHLLDHARPALVGLCDIDGLKHLNDRFGHDAGDHLLRQAAQRLTAAMAGTGIAGRLGGDEFVLLWHHLPADPLAEAHAVLDQLAQPVTVAGHHTVIHASLGLAAAGSLTGRDLLAAADAAMYQAKHSRTPVRLYDLHTPPPRTDRPTRRRRDPVSRPAPS